MNAGPPFHFNIGFRPRRTMFTSFPTWAYGPGGQAEIFERIEDIPDGWVDAPGKVEEVIAVVTYEDLREGAEMLLEAVDTEIFERFSHADVALLPPVERREEIARDGGEAIRAEVDEALVASLRNGVAPIISLGEDTPPKRPRKLGRGAAVPPTDSEGTLSPAVRVDAIAAIRGAGGTIEDTATDGEIVGALNSLGD